MPQGIVAWWRGRCRVRYWLDPESRSGWQGARHWQFTHLV